MQAEIGWDSAAVVLGHHFTAAVSGKAVDLDPVVSGQAADFDGEAGTDRCGVVGCPQAAGGMFQSFKLVSGGVGGEVQLWQQRFQQGAGGAGVNDCAPSRGCIVQFEADQADRGIGKRFHGGSDRVHRGGVNNPGERGVQQGLGVVTEMSGDVGTDGRNAEVWAG